MKLKIAIISVAILLAAACGFLYIKGTPQYSVYQLGRAITNHDPDAALKYIDIDSVTESLLKNLFLEAGSPRRLDKSMKAVISMNMPSIKEGVKTYIITAIRTGESIGKGKGEDLFGIGDLGLYNLGVAAVWRLSIKTEGATALVSLKDRPGESAKMIKTEEGYWRFVAVLIDKPGKD
jgi:hypothetical protein